MENVSRDGYFCFAPCPGLRSWRVASEDVLLRLHALVLRLQLYLPSREVQLATRDRHSSATKRRLGLPEIVELVLHGLVELAEEIHHALLCYTCENVSD